MTAVLIPEAPAPGTEEWLRYMTGSKIAAVMQLSPYESPYSLWHRMAGVVPPEGESEVTSRGHYLEPGILAWIADQHPEWVFQPGGMWSSESDPRFAITPDALAVTPDGELVLVEAKSALDKDVWGEELTDEIPVYYRCQVMWGMGILGIRRTVVAVLTSYLQFREYEVVFDPADYALLVEEADRFMRSLDDRTPPDIDSHKATYEVVREIHPDIDPVSVDVPAELAVRYTRAKVAAKAADDEARLRSSQLTAHMGSAQKAVFNGRAIASRQLKFGKPTLVAARNLEPLPLSLLEEQE